MRRVSQAFYGVPKFARRSILWTEHVQDDEATAGAQEGPSGGENHAGLNEMVQSKADYNAVEGRGREGKLLRERSNEIYGALGCDFVSKQ